MGGRGRKGQKERTGRDEEKKKGREERRPGGKEEMGKRKREKER